ncbi:hypothetical protein [Sinosporangium siamense]|nr:hypothetical protein [Sinosporangium siamense]
MIASGAAVLALITVTVYLGSREGITPMSDSREQTFEIVDDTPRPSTEAEPSATTTTSTAREQALAINDILEQSKPSRGALRSALSEMLRCSNMGEAIVNIEHVTRQRGRQADEAEGLNVSALADGAELKDSLVQALSASYRADKAYLKWAKRYRSRACSGKTVGDPNYDAGNAASAQATSAKSDFVALWNPVAEQEGLLRRTNDEI